MPPIPDRSSQLRFPPPPSLPILDSPAADSAACHGLSCTAPGWSWSRESTPRGSESLDEHRDVCCAKKGERAPKSSFSAPPKHRSQLPPPFPHTSRRRPPADQQPAYFFSAQAGWQGEETRPRDEAPDPAASVERLGRDPCEPPATTSHHPHSTLVRRRSRTARTHTRLSCTSLASAETALLVPARRTPAFPFSSSLRMLPRMPFPSSSLRPLFASPRIAHSRPDPSYSELRPRFVIRQPRRPSSACIFDSMLMSFR